MSGISLAIPGYVWSEPELLAGLTACLPAIVEGPQGARDLPAEEDIVVSPLIDGRMYVAEFMDHPPGHTSVDVQRLTEECLGRVQQAIADSDGARPRSGVALPGRCSAQEAGFIERGHQRTLPMGARSRSPRRGD